MSSPSERSTSSDDEKIVEDAPRMQSVSMLAAASAPLRLREPAVAKDPFLRSGSPLEAKVALLPPAAAPPPSWRVLAAPAVPTYYQLQRTHVSVDAAPVAVAQRVADRLRDMSMSAVFHDDEARADVETGDHVTFSVSLWTNDDHRVLVEVQRTSGCCFLFHQACKAVLRAARGEAAGAAKPETFGLPRCIPAETEAEREECLKESLDICACMLQSPRHDAHLMGMEGLVRLSDCCRSRSYAARCILGSPEFLQTLVSLIQSSSLVAAGEVDADRTDVEREYLAVMHRHAMTVLANCLSALQDDKTESPSAVRPELTSDTMLMALITQVAHCDKRPHEACQAVRCLQELMLLKDCDCKKRALELGLANFADHARLHGSYRHLQLQNESLKLLQQLKN